VNWLRFHRVFLLFIPFPRRRLSVPRPALLFGCPSPHGQESTPHPCCITEEQKRECQTPPSRSLSRPSPHPASRWGCLFSRVSLNPKSPPKWTCTSPSPHSSAARHPPAPLCHAPVPRARPLPRPTLAASSFQIFNHLLSMA